MLHPEPAERLRCSRNMTAHSAGWGSVIAALVAGAIVVTASSAFAKGPSQAVIEGPGLSSPVALRPPGQPTIGPALATMVQKSDLFDGLFRTRPDSTFTRPPEWQLGPRYTVTYTLPGPGGASIIVQYIYPYAFPAPVTHMPPDQPFWRNERTAGGWHLAGPALKDMLIEVGLPKYPPGSPPERVDASQAETGASFPIYIAVAMLAIALGIVTVTSRRARQRRAAVLGSR